MLGRFIGVSHVAARLYGVDLRQLLAARSIEEQRCFFETMLAPLFDKPAVRWATANRLSLYGLGIPPAQYEALAGGNDMRHVLRSRVERLACGFSLDDNYFAWQAFGRSYAGEASGPLPPYLRREHFHAVRSRAHRVEVMNRSITEHLAGCPRCRSARSRWIPAGRHPRVAGRHGQESGPGNDCVALHSRRRAVHQRRHEEGRRHARSCSRAGCGDRGTCVARLPGVETLISHPATMTHASVPTARRVALGITDGLVRISAGVEDIDDLKEDLEQALARI